MPDTQEIVQGKLETVSGAKPRREAMGAADNKQRKMELPKAIVMMTSQALDVMHQAKGLCFASLGFHLALVPS